MMHPCMQMYISVLNGMGMTLKQHDLDLGRFGAPTQKPIHLYAPVEMQLNVPSLTFQRAENHPPTAVVQPGLHCAIYSHKL